MDSRDLRQEANRRCLSGSSCFGQSWRCAITRSGVVSQFILLVLLVGTLATGCQKPVQDVAPVSSPLEDLGRLPGLRRSGHPGLKEELARIEEESGTPEQLTVPLPPAEENLAAILVDLFPKERVEFLVAQTGDWLRAMPEQAQWKAEDRKAAEQFIKSFQPQRATLRMGLTRPKCVFPIRFTAGFGADLGFADQCILAIQIEGLAANMAVAQGDLKAAVDAWNVAFRLCGVLARARHPQLRWQAASLRRQSLDWLQFVVAHPEITRDDLGKLADTVQKELAIWPADTETWIAARALGMHAYELVRIGRLYDVLTEREINRLRQSYDLESLVRIAQENVDQDELYYLAEMREVIRLSQKPYYQRVDELEKRRGTWESKARDDETIVACRILLPEIPIGQKTQAEDLANVCAWLVALRAAREEKVDADFVNPLTGNPFIVESQEGTLYVGGIGTDLGRHGAIEVPHRPPPKTAIEQSPIN